MKASKQIPIFGTKHAMESLRASGHDLFTALGEPIDNSQQANAREIRIEILAKDGLLDKIGIADDGDGMSKEIIPMCLALGFSTRFNERKGIGRFGVGATLSGISQVRRIEVYSRQKTKDPFLYSYLDLDELSDETRHVPEPVQKEIPDEFEKLIKGKGTLMVWSKCDRVSLAMKRGKEGKVDVQQIKAAVAQWLGRTYRTFIDAGLKIYVNGMLISAHDPLFLMTTARFPEDSKSEILVEDSFEWPVYTNPEQKSVVSVRITLLPEEWRRFGGKGRKENSIVGDRRIHENEGVSILRANREIFYGIVPHLYGSEKMDIDRWHGIEISFEPELDEWFAVRHVKKGAEPIEALKDRLRTIIKPAVHAARKRVQNTFAKTAKETKLKEGIHSEAEVIAQEHEKKAPKGEVGRDTPPEVVEAKLDAAVEVIENNIHPDASTAEVKERLKQRPFSIIDDAWPGKEFIETEHLGPSKSLIYINNRHPFFERVYNPILKAAGLASGGESKEEGESEDAHQLTKEDLVLIKNGIDLLLIAYAMAEGRFDKHQDAYSDLRSHWGMHLFNMLNELRSAK